MAAAAAAVEKRDIMEAVGCDVSQGATTDNIAAVGAASARLHYGDRGLPTFASSVRPTATPADRIAAELAPMLWHLKAGGQEQTAMRVAVMFVLWMRYKRDFQSMPGEQLTDFAACVVSEWVRPGCKRCRGAGLLEVDRRLGKVAPRSHARNARLVTCDQCHGSRRASPNHQQRAEALGIDRKAYDDGRWFRRFTVALVWLDQIARRLRRPLQLESRKRSIAPQ